MDENLFQNMVKTLYLERKKDGIKSDFGKSLLIGGSRKYPNAILISASYSALSGNGYTALSVPNDIYPIVASRAPLTSIYELSVLEEDDIAYDAEDIDRILSTYTSILIGNGLKQSEANLRLLKLLLSSYQGNLIIDATGLNLLAEVPAKTLKSAKPKNLLLTPHLGEAKRLLKLDFSSRNPEDYLPAAKEYAQKFNANLLLKSVSSLLVTPEGEMYPSSYKPTPALGKAGSGDGLAGYIAGLAAYADNIYPFTDVVLFADEMIHRAAALSAEKNSSGLADILTAKEEIVNIVKKK